MNERSLSVAVWAQQSEIQQWPRWVDPTNGQVRPMADAHPGTQLQSGAVAEGRLTAEATPTFDGSQWDFSLWQWLSDWLGQWIASLQGFLSSGWAVYLLLLLAILFLAVILYLVSRMDWGRRLWVNRAAELRRRRPVTKEELPFELEAAHLTVDGLWGEAVRAKQQGDFRRALMFLYSYLLIELDARQLIRLRRGKTNRSYCQELRLVGSVYPTFTATMEAFERTFFGRYDMESRVVEDLFSQVGRLELK